MDVLRRRVRIERAVAEVRGTAIVGTPKTHQARTVAVPALLADALGAYMRGVPKSDAAILFPDHVDGHLRVTTWKRRVFDPAAARAGLTPPPLRVHDLRHSAVSLAIASGASVKVVQSQIGHRSATTTLDRCGHLFPDDLDVLADSLERMRGVPPADSVRTQEASVATLPVGQGL